MAETQRLDAQLISGSQLLGDAGGGVLGANIPASGPDGASILNAHVTHPADDASEFRLLVTAWPATGSLFVEEDGSFRFIPAGDGSESFSYQVYKDYVQQGGTHTVTLNVGIVSVTRTASLSAVIQTANAAVASMGSVIQAGRTTQGNADAAIVSMLSGTSTVNAAISQALAVSGSLQAVVLATQTAVAGMDAFVQGGSGFSAQMGAAILHAEQAISSIQAAISVPLATTTSIAAAVQQARSAMAGMDAVMVASLFSVSGSIDAVIRTARQNSGSMDAYIFDPSTEVFTARSRERINAMRLVGKSARIGNAYH